MALVEKRWKLLIRSFTSLNSGICTDKSICYTYILWIRHLYTTPIAREHSKLFYYVEVSFFNMAQVTAKRTRMQLVCGRRTLFRPPAVSTTSRSVLSRKAVMGTWESGYRHLVSTWIGYLVSGNWHKILKIDLKS